jgi:hypothetical protein
VTVLGALEARAVDARAAGAHRAARSAVVGIGPDVDADAGVGTIDLRRCAATGAIGLTGAGRAARLIG